MKSVNLQCMYEVPDGMVWIARNRDGILCGFRHAPVRDYEAGNGEWIDSVDGSNGEIIEYADWEKSVREVAGLCDTRIRMRKSIRQRQLDNVEKTFEKRRKNGRA